MRKVFLGLVLSVMALGFLSACGKGYTIHTDVDQYGAKKKVVVTSDVDSTNWSLFFGSDVTVERPMTCPFEAIGWKGQLDKEQCTFEHHHLVGADQGQTSVVRTVHASETVGKKLIGGIWWMLLLIPNLFGGGDQSQSQGVTQNISTSTLCLDAKRPCNSFK